MAFTPLNLGGNQGVVNKPTPGFTPLGQTPVVPVNNMPAPLPPSNIPGANLPKPDILGGIKAFGDATGGTAIGNGLGTAIFNIGQMTQGKNPFANPAKVGGVPVGGLNPASKVDVPKMAGGVLQAGSIVAGTGLPIAGAATVAGRIVQAGLGYGALGGIAGAGSAMANGTDSTKGFGQGALYGAIGGVAGQSIGEGIGALKNVMNKPVNPSDAAWQDIQPKATEKTVQAYRAQGATNPKTLLKGVTLNPSGADTKVVDAITPLYEDGTLTPKMSTESKINVLATESKNLAAQSDALVAQNNKIVESPEVQSVLQSAKDNSRVIFGSDKTLESAYSAPQDAFVERLQSGQAGATGTDTVSLRDALKSWDAEMKSKFPNLWKSAATGEISPTDNARFSGIMDTHTAVRNLIAQKLGPDVPYLQTLAKNSSFIRAAEMMNKGASNVSKVDSLINLVKNHPYFAGIAGWESLKHTVAPGLPGI